MTVRKITTLVENTASWIELLAEHGLAYWIEVGDRKILFDTGQGLVLGHNAKLLGARLEQADSIVVSHGHMDHTGGLAFALEQAPQARIYLHPQAIEGKYFRNSDGSVLSIGMSSGIGARLASRENVTFVEAPTEIAEKVWATGPIPRVYAFENTGDDFYANPECTREDDLMDDQSIFMETETGTVVILGCAHSGVINTLHHIRSLTGGAPIRLLVGGMHLMHADEQRVIETMRELHRMEVHEVRPCHCTGFAASALMWQEFPGKCDTNPAGAIIDCSD